MNSNDCTHTSIWLRGTQIVDNKRNLKNIMSASFGDLKVQNTSKFNNDVFIKGQLHLNDGGVIVGGNVQCDNINTSGAILNDSTKINGDLNLQDATIISDYLDDSMIVKTFTGSMLNPGDFVEHIVYNQTNHSRSILELKILIHDVNSNTFYHYSDGKYMWSRSWTFDPQETIIGTPINIGSTHSSNIDDFEIIRYQSNNNVIVKITQNTEIATNTRYKIVAKVLQT